MLVYVISENGVRLMPCNRGGRVRNLLKTGRAEVVKRTPFTIQLKYKTGEYVQPVDLKVDTGYQNIGISACSDKAELYSAEVALLEGQRERNDARRKYRRTRKNRLRYRKPRFDNRRRQDGWLAPSIQHKADSHIKAVERVMTILPVSKIILEVANFDIQKLKNPDIEGTGYQQGEMTDYRNLREYVFFRDNYTCQICGKNTFKDKVILQMHHVEYWNNHNRANTPANCLTVCSRCHCSKNHQPGGKLWGLKAVQKPFKAETFMATVRWMILNRVKALHNIPVEAAYGYMTKDKRITLNLPKAHFNDAYCVGDKQPSKRLATTLFFQEKRKNNRSLTLFYDAKYIDKRDSKQKSGKELFSGRTTRNKNNNTENLHKYRTQKVKSGRISTRKQRYEYQPYDTVLWKNRAWSIGGAQNNGTRVLIFKEPKNKAVSIKDLKLITHSNTLYLKENVG